MWVTNASNAAAAQFAASASWTTPPIALSVGQNVISVYGTNAAGGLAIDTLMVIGVPEPAAVAALLVIGLALARTRRAAASPAVRSVTSISGECWPNCHE